MGLDPLICNSIRESNGGAESKVNTNTNANTNTKHKHKHKQKHTLLLFYYEPPMEAENIIINFSWAGSYSGKEPIKLSLLVVLGHALNLQP